MSKKPIETMLDNVEWQTADVIPPTDDIPHVTHNGVLSIGGIDVRVYQLSNGQRVIHGDDLVKLFTGGE